MQDFNERAENVSGKIHMQGMLSSDKLDRSKPVTGICRRNVELEWEDIVARSVHTYVSTHAHNDYKNGQQNRYRTVLTAAMLPPEISQEINQSISQWICGHINNRAFKNHFLHIKSLCGFVILLHI